MLRRSDKKKNIKSPLAPNIGPDSHSWENKMEIIRLISGKPDLKLNTLSKSISYPSQTK